MTDKWEAGKAEVGLFLNIFIQGVIDLVLRTKHFLLIRQPSIIFFVCKWLCTPFSFVMFLAIISRISSMVSMEQAIQLKHEGGAPLGKLVLFWCGFFFSFFFFNIMRNIFLRTGINDFNLIVPNKIKSY